MQLTLRRVIERDEALTREEARQWMETLLRDSAGDIPDVQIAAFLAALATRGATATELAGFADAMQAAAVPLPLSEDERIHLVDTCGTGGDGAGTFNISTAAALVAAAAGAKIAKHGNRSVTSQCGSADVLEALGVAVDLSPAAAVASLRATGFMFLYAPLLHPAMRRVQPLRKALGFRTVFNLLGPIANPAGAPAQVIGVYAAAQLPLVAETLAQRGVRHAFVVHGAGVIDEIALHGPSDIAEVRDPQKGGLASVRTYRVEPEELGLHRAPLAALAGGGAQENAGILRAIFGGQAGPARDVVLLNAAAALVVSGIADTLPQGVRRAAEAIDSGAVVRTLESLAAFGQQHF